jgi:hypothetical protein
MHHKDRRISHVSLDCTSPRRQACVHHISARAPATHKQDRTKASHSGHQEQKHNCRMKSKQSTVEAPSTSLLPLKLRSNKTAKCFARCLANLPFDGTEILPQQISTWNVRRAHMDSKMVHQAQAAEITPAGQCSMAACTLIQRHHVAMEALFNPFTYA